MKHDLSIQAPSHIWLWFPWRERGDGQVDCNSPKSNDVTFRTHPTEIPTKISTKIPETIKDRNLIDFPMVSEQWRM
jgi:hypothetical protein